MALQTKDYSATAKSSSGGITYTFILRVTENSTDILQNKSNLTVEAILKQSYSGTAFYLWGTGVSCTLNGNQIFSDYQQRRLDGTAEAVYYTWTGDVTHGTDGSLRLKVGGKLWQNSSASYTPPTMVIEENDNAAMTLTPIPRASTIGAADADIGSRCTISVNRKNSGFTHTIGWRFGKLSGFIGPNWESSNVPAKLTDTSISFSVPESFYAEIPDSKSGICDLTITTYSGNTQIGDAQTTQFVARASENNCTPIVFGTIEDVNEATLTLTGDAKRLVKFFSTAHCAITADPRNSATIREKHIGGVMIEENTLDILNVETADLSFYAVDSRGYSGFAADEELILVPYIRLTNNAVCKRVDPTSGKAVLTFSGDWFGRSFGASENALTLSYSINNGPLQSAQVATDGDKYSATVDLAGLDYQSSHTITAIVSDKLDSVPKEITLDKGIPVYDWGEHDFAFNVPISFPSANDVVVRSLRFDTNTSVLVPAVSRGIGLVAVMNNAHQMAVYIVCNYEANTQDITAVSIAQRIAGDGELSFAMKDGQLEITCIHQWSYGWYIRNVA